MRAGVSLLAPAAAAAAPAAAVADTTIGPLAAATIVFARCQTADHCRLARTTAAGGAETPIAGAAATDGWESGLADRRLEAAPQADVLTGFAALHDDDAIEVRAPASHDGTCINHVEGTSPPCELALAGPLAFSGRRR